MSDNTIFKISHYEFRKIKTYYRSCSCPYDNVFRATD